MKHSPETSTSNVTPSSTDMESTMDSSQILYFDASDLDPSKTVLDYPTDKIQGFNHLFQASMLDTQPLLDEAASAEGAERLMNTLPDQDPYKDYAAAELALFYLDNDNPKHAIELMNKIHDTSVAVHVLSKIVRYEDLPEWSKMLTTNLHTLAIAGYNEVPDLKHANAVLEASEALPEDKELSDLAIDIRRKHRATTLIKM